jgi:hypothetical protein
MKISSKECIKQVINFSKINIDDRFDNARFNPEKLSETLYAKSPKMVALLKKIKSLDRRDYWLYGKLYKHFIFTDLKKGSAKMIASSLMSAGYMPIFQKKGNTIVNEISPNNDSNFALLSSTAMFKTPFNPKYIKSTLDLFNERPANIYGDKVRIIILDSGFKEGVDLFDVKYVHLFEEPETQADATQSIGRALRYCGHKGLPYSKWGIDVFIYRSVYKGDRIIKKGDNNSIDIIDKVIKENSIDFLLNKNSCKKKSFF